LRTIGTFLVIVASWAIWSTQSWAELGMVVGKLLHPGPRDVAWILAGLAGLGLAAVLYDRFEKPAVAEEESRPRIKLLKIGVPASAFRCALVSAGLVFLVYAQTYFYYPATVANAIDNMRDRFLLSTRDQSMLTRGYYEDLGDVARFNPELADLFKGRPPHWDRCWALHRTGGFPSHEFLPSRRVQDKGVILTTNRWSMRDRDYEKEKPPGVYRMALLGSSNTMGTGVADNETFENIVEDRLNREISPKTGVRYEIMNFSVAGWGPVACYTDLMRRVFDFQPDAVIWSGMNEFTWATKEPAEHVLGYYDLPYPELLAIARASDMDKSMGEQVIREKMWEYRADLLYWTYNSVVQECRKRGVRPLVVYLPPHTALSAGRNLEEAVGQVEVATRAGFSVIDLVRTFDSLPDLSTIWLAPWDHHPNREGHRLLAEGFYSGLVRELNLSDTVTNVAAGSSATSESKGEK